MNMNSLGHCIPEDATGQGQSKYMIQWAMVGCGVVCALSRVCGLGTVISPTEKTIRPIRPDDLLCGLKDKDWVSTSVRRLTQSHSAVHTDVPTSRRRCFKHSNLFVATTMGVARVEICFDHTPPSHRESLMKRPSFGPRVTSATSTTCTPPVPVCSAPAPVILLLVAPSPLSVQVCLLKSSSSLKFLMIEPTSWMDSIMASLL